MKKDRQPILPRTFLTAMLLLINFLIMACSCSSSDSDTEPNTGGGTTPPENPESPSDVVVYTTTNTRSKTFEKTTVAYVVDDKVTANVLTVNPSITYQTMDGFGAAITGSSAYNLKKMSPADRTAFLTETFSVSDGMGYSYVRVPIGCSDFSLSEYTCCDTEGIENFALTDEETKYIIPILKEILAINPAVKILGSPWTAPRWMKVDNLTNLNPYNSWTSGQLNPAYYSDYATYFVKWIQAFAAEGIQITAVTLQNEPLNRGNSASMYMEWEEQRNFIKNAVGPAFASAGIITKIYTFDHNYNYDGIGSQNDYPVKIYNDAEASAYVAGAAYHNYGGSRSELNDIHNQAPDKELIFTETTSGTWNDGLNFENRLMDDMAEVALGTVNNWCRAVMVWNLMLDTDLGPNRPGGCTTGYGAVDINKADYQTIRRNSQFYIIGHLSAVVRPEAVRVASEGYSATGLTASSFVNADGSLAVVFLNNSSYTRTVTVAWAGKKFNVKLPAKSVVSCLTVK